MIDFQLFDVLGPNNHSNSSSAIAIAIFFTIWLFGLWLTPTVKFRRSDLIVFWVFALWATFAGTILCFTTPKSLGMSINPYLAMIFAPIFVLISKLKWDKGTTSTSKKKV